MSELLPWMAPYSGWAVMSGLGLFGLWLMVRGLFGDRSCGRRRCPRCWYDLSHSPTPTCSECGHTLRRDRDSERTRRHWRIALIGLLMGAALPVLVVQRRVGQFGWGYYRRVGPLYFLAPEEVLHESRSGPYLIRIAQDRRRGFDGARFDDRQIRIYRGRQRLWEYRDWYVTPGKQGWDEQTTSVGPIQDLDGDGVPEFICESSGGGNSGCSLTHIVRLGEVPEDLNPHPPNQRDDGIRGFADLDGDGLLDMIGHDHSFVMWNTCHAASAYPRVAFRLKGRLVVLAPELMRTPEPPYSPAELESAREACQAAGWSPRTTETLYAHLLGTMLDLVYSGHADAAYQFCERAWPGPEREKAAFLAEFGQRLARSPYRSAIEALGHPPLPQISATDQ